MTSVLIYTFVRLNPFYIKTKSKIQSRQNFKQRKYNMSATKIWNKEPFWGLNYDKLVRTSGIPSLLKPKK